MAGVKKKTSDALEMLNDLVGDDPKRRLEIEREIVNSKISRLEDADNSGNRTLPTLLGILHALDTRAQLDLNPNGGQLVTL